MSNINLNQTLNTTNAHIVKLADWLNVEEVKNDVGGFLLDPEKPVDAVITKAHILLTMADKNGCVFEARIYAKRVGYFMACINRQFDNQLRSTPLSAMLDYMKAHEFEIWEYRNEYGLQYDFSDPRKASRK